MAPLRAYIDPMSENSTDRRRGEPSPEQPRSEPEILAPGEEPRAGARGRRGAADVFVFVDRHGREQRVTFKKPGPLAVFLALFVIGLVAAAVVIFSLGFLLIAVPLVALFVGALIGWFYLRGFLRRLWPPAGSR